MATETIVFLSCTVICLVLAAQVTHYWLGRTRDPSLSYWMAAAWLLTAADAVFAARGILPKNVGRVAPTLMVTLGQAVLFLGAQQAAGIPRNLGRLAAIVGLQVAGLIAFQYETHPSNWRIVFNGCFWAGLNFASFVAIRRAHRFYSDSLNSPAAIFFAQGVFHVLRVAAGILFEAEGWVEASAALHFVSNIEVLLFMGALFIALLMTHLRLRHEELTKLSRLLPVCAWCQKIRDDDGYWKEVADYFSARRDFRVTHGICQSCASKVAPGSSIT